LSLGGTIQSDILHYNDNLNDFKTKLLSMSSVDNVDVEINNGKPTSQTTICSYPNPHGITITYHATSHGRGGELPILTYVPIDLDIEETTINHVLLTDAVTNANGLSFSTPHGLVAGTSIVYNENSVTAVSGLVDGTTYYVLDFLTSLLTNAVTGTNELSFASAHGLLNGTAVVYNVNVATSELLTDAVTGVNELSFSAPHGIAEGKPVVYSNNARTVELLTNAMTDANELSFAAPHGLLAGTAVVYNDNLVASELLTDAVSLISCTNLDKC